jgi:hypothetical protein
MITTLYLANLAQGAKLRLRQSPGRDAELTGNYRHAVVRIAMRTGFLSAALILAFAAPAYAQGMNIVAPNLKYTTQDEVDAAAKQEKDYKATLKKLPEQKTSNDPWGNVRNNGTAPTDPKTKKKKASTQ